MILTSSLGMYRNQTSGDAWLVGSELSISLHPLLEKELVNSPDAVLWVVENGRDVIRIGLASELPTVTAAGRVTDAACHNHQQTSFPVVSMLLIPPNLNVFSHFKIGNTHLSACRHLCNAQSV